LTKNGSTSRWGSFRFCCTSRGASTPRPCCGRDFLLARLDIDDDEDAIRVHAESSQALALLAEQIVSPALSDDPGQLLEQATATMLTTADVRMQLPSHARSLFTTQDQSMEAAGQRSELGESLTAPVQPEMRQFRRWLCDQIRAQAEGQPLAPWLPEPDEVRLPSRGFASVQWELTWFTATTRAYVAADDTNGIVAVSDSAAQLRRLRLATTPHRQQAR
jgi:hypothetical protein